MRIASVLLMALCACLSATPWGELGDYEVPAGRYGVAAGELLRIRCSTGQPLGIVRS